VTESGKATPPDKHTLEYLLDYDGTIYYYEYGYHMRFQFKRVPVTDRHPHGLKYSLTLHDDRGNRILGFDNGHNAPNLGSSHKRMQAEADHWHRTEDDPGRPYEFISIEKLLDDFFNEAKRVFQEHGIRIDPIDVGSG